MSGVKEAYAAHRSLVYQLSLRYAAGRSDWAEDLAHDVFVKLIEHYAQLNTDDDLAGWLYRVTANLALSRLRGERARIRRLMLSFSGQAEEFDDSASDLFDRRQQASEVMQVMQNLPTKERVVLCMKVLDGKSQTEIATILSMSEGYVSKLLARAWEHVRQAGWEVSDEPS